MNVVGTLYSNIPILIVDGSYGAATKQAVQIFQQNVNLNVDGIVGASTWEALFTLANEIKNGDTPSLGLPDFPGKVLRLYSTGEDVRFIQERLRIISIYYPSIPSIPVDGVYGVLTQNAVMAFQQLLGLQVDGVIGSETWNKINIVYMQLTH